jgi:5-methylcytosine-specific restriction endonuclease McrA
VESGRYIKRKYDAISLRSFKTKLEVFTFDICINKQFSGGFSTEDFHRFEITDKIVTLYEKAWQMLDEERLSEDGPTIQDIDNFIKNWNDQNIPFRKLLLKGYKFLFQKEYFPFPEFIKLFKQDPQSRICHYCKITDHDIESLRSKGRINTKQFRGYSMEIDRINSNREYRPENVVLACYWCNNAKTDEFTSIEFSDHIGPGIGKVWQERKNQ